MNKLILILILYVSQNLIAQENRDIHFFFTKALEKIISIEDGYEHNKHIFILQEYDQYHKENKYVNDLTKQPHISIDSLIHIQIYDACQINTQSHVLAMSKDISKYVDFTKFQHTRLYVDRIYKINNGDKVGLLLPFYLIMQQDEFIDINFGYVYANWYPGFVRDFRFVYILPISEPNIKLIKIDE